MAFFTEMIDRVKDMANGFLNGNRNMPPRTSYYVDDEEGMAYQQQPPAMPPEPLYQAHPQPQMDYRQPRPVQPAQPTYRTQADYQEQAFGFEPQPQPIQPNVSYFPNAAFQSNGEKFMHVERVAQVISREDAHTIVAFMMNNESVIVSCESIASAQEVQRCIDLISGAAYALGCQITQLSLAAKVFLVSPASVMVMCDEASHRLNGRNADGTPMRRAARRSGSASRQQQPAQENYAEYEEYQQPENEYQEVYEPQQPYQPQRSEGYGRPTYQSAAM